MSIQVTWNIYIVQDLFRLPHLPPPPTALPSESVPVIILSFLLSTLPMKRAGIAQSVQRRATGYGLGFNSRQWQKVLLYSTDSRPALELTQPLIHWVPGVLSSDVKQPGRETDHPPPSSAEVKNSRAIPPIPHTLSSRDA
jgi:hypothetical protein